MLQFTDREEVSRLIRVLSSSKHEISTYFKLSGESGCGKTELLKKAVERIIKSNMVFIYIDITPDEFQSTSFFPTLLETVYMPLSYHYNTITNIPENLALSKYIKKIFKAHRSFEKFFNTLTLSAEAIPTAGGPISMLIDKWLQERMASIDNMLFLYFKHIIKKARINLIIDNYQFLPNSIKKVLEIGINQFNYGFTFFVIERTNGIYNHEKSFCSAFHHDFCDLEYISHEHYEHLIENQGITISDEQKEKIWTVTKGNLKDIDIILNEVRINPGYDITSNKIAIQNLNTIQRSILLITALFPAGMKEGFVIQFIRNILSETEEQKIKNAIIKLSDLGYIYINSNSHDTIKPTHETVINHVKDSVDIHDLESFCSRLSDSLEELAGFYHGTKDYSYLLHCWVGINSSENLKKKSSMVQELISIKFKENEYYYIDTIATSITDIIIYLPESTIEKILISFQRVSDFSNGINILNGFRHADSRLYDKFRIFYAKFLIQTYDFEDALKELENVPNSSLKLLCQTNALQHLGLDSDVEELLSTELSTCTPDENYYIILRNTAHFYDYDEAKKNLLLSLKYFSTNKHTSFTVATIQNNLAVINIWKGKYEEAEQYLKPAIRTLEQIYSNEIFEPYCNKSILHLMRLEYDTAYKYAKNALENCPKTLTLDIVMLSINLIIIRLCQQKLTVEKALIELEQLSNEYPLIEDPWYEFQLLYNRKQLAEIIQQEPVTLRTIHERYISEYCNTKTKFYILKPFKVQNFQVELCLGLSPNWRY